MSNGFLPDHSIVRPVPGAAGRPGAGQTSTNTIIFTHILGQTLLQHPHEDSPRSPSCNQHHTENAPIKHVTRAREERGGWAIRLARREYPPASKRRGGGQASHSPHSVLNNDGDVGMSLTRLVNHYPGDGRHILGI